MSLLPENALTHPSIIGRHWAPRCLVLVLSLLFLSEAAVVSSHWFIFFAEGEGCLISLLLHICSAFVFDFSFCLSFDRTDDSAASTPFYCSSWPLYSMLFLKTDSRACVPGSQ